MKVHYLDSSVWAKRYFQETGSARVHRLFSGTEALGCSWLGYVEVSAALARQSGARRIEVTMRRSIETQMDRDWSRFLKMETEQKEFAAVVNLARRYGLRGADAVHLAAVTELSARLRLAGDDLVFWTADEELAEAGRMAGLPVENPL